MGDQIKKHEVGGHVARMGEIRTAYNILFGRPEGKTTLRRPKRRWEDNIRMDLRETGWVWTGFICFRIGTRGLL